MATFDPAADFGELMAAEARRRGIERIRQPIILGDGAPWIWNLANRHFPAATQIVDPYHAREHLHELADIVSFINIDQQAWLDDRLDELDAGDIPLQRRLSAPLHRRQNHRPRQVRRLRQAPSKAPANGQRLKLSGMHWSVPGATGILTLRCHTGDHFDQIWARPHNQTAAA